MTNLWTDQMFEETKKMLFPGGKLTDEAMEKKVTEFFLHQTYKFLDAPDIATLRLFVNYCGLTKYDNSKK